MANVLLGATGSVAAVRVPALAAELVAAGHDVKVVATDAAAYFFDPADPALAGRLYRDADEWPGDRYQRGDAVLHVELRTWADLFLIAPLDANTLAKLAVGLCDNCLTCVWRAWDMTRPVVLAPAMNTLMWEHPFTCKHLRAVAADFGAGELPADLDEEALVAAINEKARGLRIVGPISKQLACGDVGVGAMAEVPEVVAAVRSMLPADGG
ncbi:MAG TPA: flavoprotein [Fimbriiglobus sp.]|nr:flavoprotein [Fimbriiglobus sp.]